MPFPILRTPFVVLSEIISLLEPNEIVTASLCSKKVKCLLTRHYQRRKPLGWRLYMIDYESTGRVDIVTSKDYERVTVISAKHISELNIRAYAFNTEFQFLYFEDRVIGSKMIADYVTDLFNLDIYGLEIDRYGMWAIDWINNQQEKMLVRFEFLQNVFFVYNSFGDEALDYALRNAPASNCCIFEEFVSDNFRFDGKLGPANHMLIGPYGHWVTLSNFVNFDVISIVVNRCSLSVSDIYSFIRHWRAGGSPRMTFLRLELGTATNFENFEEEFEVVETDISGEYSLSDFTNDYSRKNKHFVNGYSIQRNDGVKAVIHYDDNCHFVMMVCPGENLHDRINYSKENFDQHFLLHQNV